MVEGEAPLVAAAVTITLHSTLKIKQENGRKGVVLLRQLNSLSHFLLFDLEGCSVGSERRSNVASGMRIEI